MRYEIKYALSIVDLEIVKQAIINHPFSFYPAFPDRVVNNVYFDTSDLLWFYQNINGDPHRTKLRYRWYNDIEDMSKGQFEIKSKSNQLGSKKYIAQSFDSYQKLEDYISTQRIFNFDLTPTLINQYRRRYWISTDKKFRITLDSQLSFRHPQNQNIMQQEDRLILEIKFAKEDFIYFDELNKFLPFRQTKYSKYATGISLIAL